MADTKIIYRYDFVALLKRKEKLNEIKVTFHSVMTKVLHIQLLFDCYYLPNFFKRTNLKKETIKETVEGKTQFQV